MSPLPNGMSHYRTLRFIIALACRLCTDEAYQDKTPWITL